MKTLLLALPLCLSLSAPTWAGSSAIILENGKILYSNESVKNTFNRPVTATFVGVAYMGDVYVCEIVTQQAEVRCLLLEDKGVFSHAK